MLSSTASQTYFDNPTSSAEQYPATQCSLAVGKTGCTIDFRTLYVLLCIYSNIPVALQSTPTAYQMIDSPKNVGWIGLGIMGGPMLRNLLGKMERETQFYVYDVVQKSIDDLIAEGQGRVHACNSSKEVADHSVCD